LTIFSTPGARSSPSELALLVLEALSKLAFCSSICFCAEAQRFVELRIVQLELEPLLAIELRQIDLR
jgi:hypothetical protein